jgi:phosphoribosylanthranilate isomerase
MKVKICGITNLEDAQAAIEAGADMLGFNFYSKSPRYISPGIARSIVEHVRSRERVPTLVGVFVNSNLDEVQSILQATELDLAQLHGDEPPEFLEQLKGCGFKALRPVSVEETEVNSVKYVPPGSQEPALLVDAYRKDQYGGTGQVGDWSIAARLAERYSILLAGGLTPENVAEAIRQVKPWGVDTASGVEVSPRQKDAAKMRAFIEQCQQIGNEATNRQRING